jgi:hypothetical protein
MKAVRAINLAVPAFVPPRYQPAKELALGRRIARGG